MSKQSSLAKEVLEQSAFGSFKVDGLNKWVEVIFKGPFNGKPQVFLSVPSQNGRLITSRMGLVNEQGFTVILQDKSNPNLMDAAAVDVSIATEPHASSSITSSGMFLSKRNIFSPFKTAFSPAMGWNCLNKKPIKIIINEAIAANTCALSSSGVIVSIEIKFAI